MDEDLKIVLTSELEADEQASAQRIAAQLPNIARLINSKSSIKVGVELDSSNIHSEAQKISQNVERAIRSHEIGVSLHLTQESVRTMKSALSDLGVDKSITKAMTAELDKMNIQIDQVSGKWEKVRDQKQRILNLTIQGTDEEGRSISYLQTYDTETGKIETRLTNVVLNLKQQRQEQEALSKAQQAANDANVAAVTKWKTMMESIKAVYTGQTSAKGIMDSAKVEVLNGRYAALMKTISTLDTTGDKFSKTQVAAINAQINSLSRLVKTYQTAERVATDLRTKDVNTVKSEQLEKLEQFEDRLRNAGTLSGSLERGIERLRVKLISAFNSEDITSFLNSFSSLQNHAAIFEEKLRGVNQIYNQIINTEKQMTSVQTAMLGLDPEADKAKLVALQSQLATLQAQKAELEAQLAPYATMLDYANRAAALEQSREANEQKIAYTQAELADRAKEYDAAMQRIPTTIADLETKLRQVVAPSETLKENMRLLREAAAAYNSDMSDKEKVQTYERLQKLISACQKEMAELSRVDRGDVSSSRFVENLEKAKADLATIGRTWSALKKDPGLNAQFQQLRENLNGINNQMDLNKWTAQFSRFKSEVKAAGRNMQSLGDILKNNLGKVLQWVSATTLLFRAFRLLRSAITTVIELDTAMIDLQKVTKATTEQYHEFYMEANETAKALGATTEEIISQTAEWARLGYTLQDAQKLAKNSAIFEAISPDMDISTATDGLVSIIKAFDIDVEDSMDGIISKVNSVGNAFAVSNGDIVEALTRSSAAMAAANNTFDETVALATAAIEITRDAASVGNGLKTLSMRIRGYDEETEEYSADVAELTGKIADLTKVASNNNRGVSLFEVGDPDTYRSTYDILKEISTIWDELTDKNRAQLLEALFGKRQAQIGSAILSNFGQAEKAVKTMSESMGSAEAEMSKIEQSLEYKLNALKETWVSVSQNLFDTDGLAIVIDALTTLSGAIDTLTEHTGLFGTVSLVVLITQLNKLRSTMSLFKADVLPVVNAIKNSGKVMDGSAESTQFYAMKLMGLDKQQQAAAMSALNLSSAQKKQIVAMQNCIDAAQQYTIQELAEKAASDKATASTLAKNMAKATEKRTTEQITSAMMAEILTSKNLTAAQKAAIMAALEQTAANEAQAFSWKAVAVNAKAAFAAMAANPMTWVMLAVAALTALVQVWQNYKQEVAEARQEAIEAANAASSLSDEIVDLTAEYLSLSEAVKTDDSAKENLLSAQNQLIDKLGIEKEKIRELTEEYGNLTDAIKAAAIEKLKEAEIDIRGGLNAQKDDLLDKADPSGVAGKSMNHIITTWGKKNTDINHSGLQALVDAGYISSGSYGSLGMELYLPSDGDFDLSTLEGVINSYERLKNMLEVVSDAGASESEVYDALYNAYNKCSSAIDAYRSSVTSLNSNLAEQYMLQGLIGKEIPNTQAEFDAYRNGVIEAAKASGKFIGTDQNIVDAVDSVLQSQAEFAGFYANKLETAGGETERFYAKLEKLTDVLSALQSKYEALEAAKLDMADGGGLSPETIEKLASAEENYLDYLYEENGVVKLNTEAWRENANAKMQSEMGEIQKEIESLEEQNEKLRENIALYEQNRSFGYDGGIWTNLINDANAQIAENTRLIGENQSKLAIYSSLYGSITGDLDAYTAALNNFSNIDSTINSMTSAFQTLADLQAEVANGFTMSLEKTLEFAQVYPQILDNATLAADGQILLNENVVNSFLEGKKAELDAQIDSQIAQLEADKAVLQAKMEAAQAQLNLAKAVAEGEGDITKELAEYRINAGNIVAQALIDAGIDEATAFKLAAAAMAQNAEEFDRVAMEVCTDVNGNFNQAAYAAAQAVYNNMTQAKIDVASFARQCHEAAKAMAGVAGGNVSGSAGVQGGSGGGTGGAGIKLNLTSGSFQGTDYTYTAKESNLDDFISQIELDISSYESAIAQIDGQIAALQALKNIPLQKFKSGSGKGFGGGGSSAKEVEEYVASIDDYREALERLRKTQEAISDIEYKIENSDNLKEQIMLQNKLIYAYQREQEALHNLNNQRDSTITAGAKALRELGFAVQYNADTNEFWISNMEHLNELTADSKGKYKTLQEATNALRKETEDLIKSLEDLNKSNREGSESWWELQSSMKTARAEILSLLDAIVEEASKAVDSIQNVYDTLHDAADEYAESGYITVDTLQSIINLGVKYVAYLQDENGQLVINEERIQKVIAARTQELAIESSLSYIEALRIAQQQNDIATLNNLLYATEAATDATWGYVYASLAMLGLDKDQYQAALERINALRALADSACQSIGQVAGSVTDELKDMQTGLDDILKYVMDMLKQRINDQIDSLEDMKDQYSSLIDMKKESLEASKEEADYQKTQAKKLKEIAKLQARIDALSLDNSREAQAEKAKLLEEMAELQDELAENSADKALDATKDSLDEMQEAYSKEKDKEIAVLEDSISSYQKLYDMAIDYISNHWDTLYGELIDWNTQYGSVLNSEITSAWENCLAAAQRYGDYVSALNSIGADIEASQQGGQNYVVGQTNYDNTARNEDYIHAIIKQMYANSQMYSSLSPEQKKQKHQENVNMGAQLAQYGVNAVFDNGYWYVDRVGGQLLYDKYKKYIYHKGGIAGEEGTLKDNEILAKLEKGEPVLTERMWKNLTAMMDRMGKLSEAMSELPSRVDQTVMTSALKDVRGSGTVNNVTNSNQPVEIQMGDIIINGNASKETVQQHQKVSIDMVDQIARILRIGR